MKKTALVFLGLILASSAFATDILLTWEKPEVREDGSKIEQIDRFNLYHSVDNVFQDVIEVSGDAISFQLPEVKTGNHTFQISTVEYGLEGSPSDPVTVSVNQSKPVKILLTVELVP